MRGGGPSATSVRASGRYVSQRRPAIVRKKRAVQIMHRPFSLSSESGCLMAAKRIVSRESSPRALGSVQPEHRTAIAGTPVHGGAEQVALRVHDPFRGHVAIGADAGERMTLRRRDLSSSVTCHRYAAHATSASSNVRSVPLDIACLDTVTNQLVGWFPFKRRKLHHLSECGTRLCPAFRRIEPTS